MTDSPARPRRTSPPWLRRLPLFFAVFWLTVTVGLLGYHFASEKAPFHWLTLLYLVMTVFFSLVAFAAFGLDKRRAGRNGPRIAEGTLHLLSLAGGWPGALIAGRLFRHKTLKASFRILFTLIVLLHVGIVGYLFWLKWNPPPTPTPAAPAATIPA